MILQALLVSKDDQTADTLIQVLAQFGIAVTRSDEGDAAATCLTKERFDQVIVDFDDPDTATLLLERCRRLTGPDRIAPVTVAVLPDADQVRRILGEGTHFVLTKPVSQEQAQTTLQAATAILKRERRQALSVSVQAPVSIETDEATPIEAILLELSVGGIDVLAAKPLTSAALVRVAFDLPDGNVHVETGAGVAWVSENGQAGLRFFDMEEQLREQLSAWLTAHSHDPLPEDADAPNRCKLTDLSLGACYVRTESPFPQSSALDLCLRVPGMEVRAEGLVRVMHPGHGMGIELPSRTGAQRKSVGEFIDFLTGQQGVEPQLETFPRALVATAEDLTPNLESDADPLLELLRSGGEMDEQEFLARMAGQRSTASVGQ